MAKRNSSPARAKRRVRVHRSAWTATLRYIESSALVAALLERDASAREALRAKGRVVTSALTTAEAARAILRARAGERLTLDQERLAIRALRRFERRSYIVPVGDAVLARVRRPFPVEPIRTLDAVHLATLELLGESPELVTIVTRDARVRDNAAALGYAVDWPGPPA